MDDKSRGVEYFKRMAVELRRARLRVAELEAARDEGIAIVGVGVRLPGGVDTPERFWDVLAQGRDVVGGFPTDRGWDLDALFADDPAGGARSATRRGCFLADAGAFDAGFFGISPREALAMDPQQRLVLETSWEALERAGVDPTSLRGTDAGVFIGASTQSYGIGAQGESEGFLLTGTAPAALSGRVSYVLGAQGPAITVDTACSSSLVSLHLAAASLRSRECSMALAGGVTVMATPGMFTELSKQGGLAADGLCKSFAAGADGTGWSEGVGVLVLQRLSDAVRDGRDVLAVLRGSAVNQDGASNGLTAPNGPAQQAVIRKALADAGVRPSEVDFVEAHGTGTVLGDPIEAQAIMAVYGQERDQPLWLGSVKSNLGHTQSAAGVVGVIKVVLALRNEFLPRTLHVDRPTDQVDWSRGSVALLTEPAVWKANGRPRRAGVSSFGVSGTNAHVVLEEAPATEPEPPTRSLGPSAGSTPEPSAGLPGEPSGGVADAPADGVAGWPAGLSEVSAEPAGPLPLVLSARTESALALQAARLADRLPAERAGVARTLATARAAWEHRAVVVAEDAVAALRDLAAGRSSPDVVTGVAGERPRTVFVFPGQGAQWVGMGRDLWRAHPVFAARMRECERALSPWVDWSLRDVVLGAGPLDRVEVLQPVTFAVMVSLAALLRSCGVEPDAVVGHSQGEIAAACVAGALTLEDAAKVVALRSATGAELGGAGGLLTVAIPVERAERDARAWPDIEIAAVNGPHSVVLAGGHGVIAEVARHYRARDVRVRPVAASFASHTRHAEPIAAKVVDLLADVTGAPPAVPWMSTVDADWVRTPIDAGYWGRNLCGRVRFADAVAALGELGFGLFVEVSTHPVLTAPISDTLADTDAAVVGTLRRDDGGPDRFARSLAEVYVRGGDVRWSAVLPAGPKAPAPTTVFERRGYWLTPGPAATGDLARVGLDPVRHPVLGAAVEDPASDGLVLTGQLSRETHPWLADHVVSGVALAPGSLLVELAVRAGERVGCPVVRELVMRTPLVLPDAGKALVQVVVGDGDGGGDRAVEVHSRVDGEWTLHATGTLAAHGDALDPPTGRGGEPDPPTGRGDALEPLTAWPPADARPVDLDDFYATLADAGYEYGPAFQGLRAAWRAGGTWYAEVAVDADAAGYAVHPALLDAALHTAFLAGDGGDPGIAFAWHRVAVRGRVGTVARVRLSTTPGGLAVTLADPDGEPVLTVGSLVTRPVALGPTPFVVAWEPSATASAGAVDLPEVADATGGEPWVLLRVPAGEGDEPARVRSVLGDVLAALRRFPTGPTRLVVATTGMRTDPVAAAVWGLVRSAQAESPGRFRLVDLPPGDGRSPGADLPPGADRPAGADLPPGADRPAGADLPRAGGPSTLPDGSEPQLVVHDGRVLTPRLVRATPSDGATRLDPERAVLITGGTGTLGAVVAEHLVAHHGVRRLVLASRRGERAAGAADLRRRLTDAGASVRIVACDVADRAAVRDLIAAAGPLTAVVHTAGVFDDALVDALDAARLDAVLRPKVDAAVHLDELTRDLDLAAFVLFSSAAGVLNSPGQGGYAAANAFLDALAARRHAAGLPATSLAWGLWAYDGGDEARAAREAQWTARSGLRLMTREESLRLFDAALGSPSPCLVPVLTDRPALRRLARSGGLDPLLRDLAPRTAPTTASGAPSLAGLDAGAKVEVLTDLVRREAAVVLGHDPADGGLAATKVFREAGFDSLTAVELRNRLGRALGVPLPVTFVFDHETPRAAARDLLDRVERRRDAAPTPATGRDFVDVYAALVDRGLHPAADALASAAAAVRPRGTAPADLADGVGVVRLASGDALPRLICLPSISTWEPVLNYSAMAAALAGRADVVVVVPPGYETDAPVAASWPALVDTLADAVLRCADGEPYVLVGYSSGGAQAHAVAAALERAGADTPLGVVLVDTYTADRIPLRLQEFFRAQYREVTRAENYSFEKITASVLYIDLHNREWRVDRDLAVPVLVLAAAEPPRTPDGAEPLADPEWRHEWPGPHERITLDGDHFTIMSRHADDVARAITTWIGSLR
ncbi:acyl transferase domain-containing protein [Saccharothrix australiensis]|uniref:Acyl transferase domain-containing protein n=1 Tax=Saccharothrix australiensis TaxID=2072 RepID=A0A495W0Z7_9PSEU|nr:acyl transferase domain-containing protein [Saccharothrix australiensis]